MKRVFFIAIILTLTICFSPSFFKTDIAFAQPGGGFGGEGGPEDDPGSGDAEGVPIDGGVSLLAGAALIYGVQKLRDKSRQKSD